MANSWILLFVAYYTININLATGFFHPMPPPSTHLFGGGGGLNFNLHVGGPVPPQVPPQPLPFPYGPPPHKHHPDCHHGPPPPSYPARTTPTAGPYPTPKPTTYVPPPSPVNPSITSAPTIEPLPQDASTPELIPEVTPGTTSENGNDQNSAISGAGMIDVRAPFQQST